jgi:hypothetical protein
MKHYKLIKKYPGSPELGTIVNENSSHNLYKLCIDEPEFWQEIVQKDYEILLYYNQNQIKSIKRLSDGEIFTVGDRYKTTDYKEIKTIGSMDISLGKLMIRPLEYGYSELSEIQHVKQPLFTTEKRKIIGYKVPYDLFTSAIKKNHLYKLNDWIENTYYPDDYSKTSKYILPKEIVEQWEVVYEETKFKVGDWITFKFNNKSVENHVGQITKIDLKRDIYWWGTLGYSSGAKDLRLATPEEIEKAITIKIGDYKAKFRNTRVSFDNVEYNRVDLCILRDLMNKGQIKSLNVGCSGQYKVDLELINKIISQF